MGSKKEDSSRAVLWEAERYIGGRVVDGKQKGRWETKE
jgi:hypothetical protein